MRILTLLILLATRWAAGAEAQTSARGPSAVRLNDQVRYYDIEGRSENDLLQAMLRGAPISEGARYFGLTSTEVRYTFRTLPTSIGCNLTNIEVYLHVVTTLPRWQPPGGTLYDVERKWRSFDRALQIHENEHKQFALDEADMIHRALRSLRTPSCATIDDEAKTIATRIRDTYLRRHLAYDARTDHGTTQGAVWPLSAGR